MVTQTRISLKYELCGEIMELLAYYLVFMQ